MVHGQSTRRSRFRAGILIAIALVALAAKPAARHLAAAELLARLTTKGEAVGLGAWGASPIDVVDASVPGEAGSVRARRYVPRRNGRAPGVVLLHGVHRDGIDEPRLVAFARSLAASGFVVLTPQLDELADYRIDAASVPTIGAAVQTLAHDAAVAPGGVSVMGFSFAGGLSLLAAADPRFAGDVRTVLAVGAHDDLARVSRFFATDEAPAPDGPPMHLRAHDYGALVLVYGHTDEFFAPGDVAAAHEALRLWLWQDWDAARKRAEAASTEARARLTELFAGRLASVSADLLASVAKHEPEMRACSPHGRLASIRAKVFVLHGAGDDVVPPTEARWLARQLPDAARGDVLVSPAIQHVEPGGKPTIGERAELVHFVAELLSSIEG